MKKIFLSVLLFSFVFTLAFSAVPHKADAWKVKCDSNCDGIVGGPGDNYVYGYFWQHKPTKNDACADLGGGCFKASGSNAVVPPSLYENFNESLSSFNSDLLSAIGNLSKTGFSPLVKNTANSTTVNSAVNSLFGLGFYPTAPSQKDPFGPTAVTATTAFQNAFKLTPTGTFGTTEINALKTFSTDISNATASLPANAKDFFVHFPASQTTLNFDINSGAFIVPPMDTAGVTTDSTARNSTGPAPSPFRSKCVDHELFDLQSYPCPGSSCGYYHWVKVGGCSSAIFY